MYYNINHCTSKALLYTVAPIFEEGVSQGFIARICKCLRSPEIDSARLGIGSWAPETVYKFGLRIQS